MKIPIRKELIRTEWEVLGAGQIRGDGGRKSRFTPEGDSL
jgi:hypothetical protein